MKDSFKSRKKDRGEKKKNKRPLMAYAFDDQSVTICHDLIVDTAQKVEKCCLLRIRG